jgi:hypothetical protein
LRDYDLGGCRGRVDQLMKRALTVIAALLVGGALVAAPAFSTHDKTPPQTSFTSGPGSRTGDRTPTFTFKSSKHPSNFICKLDGRRFKGCRSPKTLKPISYGRHGFYVKAIDSFGNTDPTAAAYRFKVPKP